MVRRTWLALVLVCAAAGWSRRRRGGHADPVSGLPRPFLFRREPRRHRLRLLAAPAGAGFRGAGRRHPARGGAGHALRPRAEPVPRRPGHLHAARPLRDLPERQRGRVSVPAPGPLRGGNLETPCAAGPPPVGLRRSRARPHQPERDVDRRRNRDPAGKLRLCPPRRRTRVPPGIGVGPDGGRGLVPWKRARPPAGHAAALGRVPCEPAPAASRACGRESAIPARSFREPSSRRSTRPAWDTA
jgi:hypothetical protein